MAEKLPNDWESLLESVKANDGLLVRDSGPWAKDKLWYWKRYLDITTNAMVGNPHFSSVLYVDLFSGPGICEVREGGERIPGSPLIAASTAKPFDKILLCELDDSLASACEERLLKRGLVESQFKVLRGDCNQQIDSMVKLIPGKALTLAFLDPTGLHLHFESVAKLASYGRVDLLILFADRMDIIRNERLYLDQDESNLDRFMGAGSNWREERESVVLSDSSSISKFYVTCYKRQLAKLGYIHSDDIPIRDRARNQLLYRLVYATIHPRGLDFWKKSLKRELSGQRGLFD